MRINLATPLKTRAGDTSKDARLKNAYAEVRGEQSVARKRPACDTGVAVVVGTAQGGIGATINGIDVAIVVNGDTVSIAEALDTIPSSEELLTSIAAYNASRDVAALNWYLQLASCSLVDLPANDDRGTSVYTGPSETEYSVPASTVEYVTIADTNCGTYRKRIDKTYSSRSDVNGKKTIYTNIQSVDPVGASTTITPFINIASLTVLEADNVLFTDASAYIPSSFTILVDGIPTVDISSVFASSISPSTSVQGSGNRIDNGDPYGPINVVSASVSLDQAVTLYYLDVHEVWSYEMA